MPCVTESKKQSRDLTRRIVRACRTGFQPHLPGSMRFGTRNLPGEVRILGCGRQGCAIEAADDKVIKITCDEGEAAFSALLAKMSMPAMLPRVERVWRLGCAYRDPSGLFQRSAAGLPRYAAAWFAVLREELRDPPARWGRKIKHAVLWFMRSRRDSQARAEITDSMLALSRSSDTEIARNANNAYELMEWANAADVRMHDLHRQNWGWRAATGELVIRDLGFTESSETEEPEDMGFFGRLRGRRRLVLRALDPLGV